MKNLTIPFSAKSTAGIFGILIFLIYTGLNGQSFSPVSIDLADAGRGVAAWADFDNDGDLDLLISGLGTNDAPVTILYGNDQGTLNPLPVEFAGLREVAGSWGDMDGDGDLDLLIAGNSATGDRTIIYRNDDGEWTETDPGMVAVQDGDVCWMDMDNDGDLDAFVSGNWMAKIYENRNGEFVMLSTDFGYFSSSAADWGDFDNDGDLDLLILGDSGAGAVSKIFRNDDGIFVELETDFIGLMAGSADWVDYDGDGDLDLCIAGNDDALEAQCFLYKNEGKEGFSLVPAGFEGFALGDADWGDYDNDGDPDMIYSGKCTGCGVAVSGIHRNDGNDVFQHFTGLFPILIRCSLQWGDYDNDGDFDFILAGTTYGGTPATFLYRNDGGTNTFEVNSGPTSPTGLQSVVNDDRVMLSWERSTDEQTPQAGLWYNIRLGTSDLGDQVVPGMSDAASGFRMITKGGNTGQLNSWQIQGLSPGTYFWSVQAIDQCYQASEYAPAESFSVTATELDDISGLSEPGLNPNPATAMIRISDDLIGGNAEIKIFDLSGRCHLSKMIVAAVPVLDISFLRSGMYIVCVTTNEKTTAIKLVKQ